MQNIYLTSGYKTELLDALHVEMPTCKV